MAVTFSNLNNDSGLKSLDDFLYGKAYISGDRFTKDDIKVYAYVLEKPGGTFPNAAKWYDVVSSHLAASFPGNAQGEDKKAAEEREAAKKPAKKKESGKSSVLLDVKPWDDETDMKKLEEAVRSIEMPGLLWGACKLVPVGYGIKKLQIMLTIVDDLVSVDTLIEEHLTVEPCNEYIQSCDIVAFNKI
ncbi:Translation elongation factor EF1B, beta/delta chain, conserved site [Sesbania bispinosa]|nr:Translation elongation factor EF1B, beta/delta chain, conserved site [Sesbania bispinosa]